MPPIHSECHIRRNSREQTARLSFLSLFLSLSRALFLDLDLLGEIFPLTDPSLSSTSPPSLLHPTSTGASPAPHLDPSTAGFRGFDPLGLSANKDLQKWMVEGELTNGRWAMAAVAGILFTDLFGLGDWWTAGAKPTSIPIPTLLAIQVAVFAFLEAKRFESWKKTGYGGFAGIAPFDPLGMDSPEMREKEIRNGRLAMLAFLGFSSVAAVRGLGPIEALKLHLGNPNVENIYTTKVRVRNFVLKFFFSLGGGGRVFFQTTKGRRALSPAKSSLGPGAAGPGDRPSGLFSRLLFLSFSCLKKNNKQKGRARVHARGLRRLDHADALRGAQDAHGQDQEGAL